MVNVGFSHKGNLAIFGSIDCFFTAIRGWDSVPITIMNVKLTARKRLHVILYPLRVWIRLDHFLPGFVCNSV